MIYGRTARDTFIVFGIGGQSKIHFSTSLWLTQFPRGAIYCLNHARCFDKRGDPAEGMLL
jgi:hypothetical protein